MFIGDGITRHLDGSYIEAPITRNLPGESVIADWQAPADIAELLGRVYPNGAPEMWVKFFGGERIEDAEREIRKRSLDYLFELRGSEIRARLHRARDWHVLHLLAEAIVAPRRHTGFPDEYRHLLPAETVKRIELYRALEARRAEEAKAAEEARRAEEAARKERELAERMAFIETASFDDLLDLLFKPDSSILNSFRRREKLTDADLNLLIYLKDTVDPVMRRGYERLFELGSSVGVKVLSLEEIEQLQAAREREAEELRAREIAATLRRIELCAEAAARGLVPQEWLPWLHRVTDVERVYKVRDHFAACAGGTDPVSNRICELLSERALSRNVGRAGAVGMLG